ncbi:MAG: rod shape-determining protein MreC [Candidatus Paceibacterota bacterium]|nr:MAG: rod shape-determining protein MreC [Candidatus Paceibacterota bacterium]
MARSSGIRTLSIALACVVLVGGVNAATGGALQRFAQRIIEPAIAHMPGVARAIHWVGQWRLSHETQDDLQAHIVSLSGRLANSQDLADENAFLRSLLRLPIPETYDRVEARLWGIRMDGDGMVARLQRGSRDGVREGGIVISQAGALVGVVRSVAETNAQVQLIMDPAFSVAGRTLEGGVDLLVRGDADRGLRLDLVSIEDAVATGETLVTTGADAIPGGLVIGTIESVVRDAAAVFQSVRAAPLFERDFDGRVLILVPPTL